MLCLPTPQWRNARTTLNYEPASVKVISFRNHVVLLQTITKCPLWIGSVINPTRSPWLPAPRGRPAQTSSTKLVSRCGPYAHSDLSPPERTTGSCLGGARPAPSMRGDLRLRSGQISDLPHPASMCQSCPCLLWGLRLCFNSVCPSICM